MREFLEHKIAYVILIGVLAALVFLVILLQFAFADSKAGRAAALKEADSNAARAMIVRSFDGGTTWKSAFPPSGEEDSPKDAGITDVLFHPARTAEIFVATDGAGLWMSPDLGIHWRRVGMNAALLANESTVYALGISKSKPATLYVSVASPDGGAILRSDDAGVSFREVYRVSSRADSVAAIVVDEDDSDHIALLASSGVVLESRDGAQTWSRGGGIHGTPSRILYDSQRPESFLVFLNSGDILLTDDFGNTWNDVLPGEEVESESAIFIPQPDGESMRAPLFFDLPFRFGKTVYDFAVDPADGSEFAAITRDGVMRSRDRGRTWQRVETIFESRDAKKGRVALFPGMPQTILFALGEDFYRSDNGGTRWTKSALPAEIEQLVTHPAQADVIFGILK